MRNELLNDIANDIDELKKVDTKNNGSDFQKLNSLQIKYQEFFRMAKSNESIKIDRAINLLKKLRQEKDYFLKY